MGWNTIVSFWGVWAYFRCELLVLGGKNPCDDLQLIPGNKWRFCEGLDASRNWEPPRDDCWLGRGRRRLLGEHLKRYPARTSILNGKSTSLRTFFDEFTRDVLDWWKWVWNLWMNGWINQIESNQTKSHSKYQGTCHSQHDVAGRPTWHFPSRLYRAP